MIQNALQRWREKVWEPSVELFERARQQWLQLKPRERVILSVLGGTAAALLGFIVIRSFFGILLQSSFIARQNIDNIERLRTTAEQLVQQRGLMLKYERLRSERPQNLDLQSFVRSKAQEMGVQVDQVNVVKPPTGEETELFLQIVLSSMTPLNSGVQYLDQLHRTLGLRIVDLKITTDFAKPGQVSMNATIAGRKDL